MTFLELQKILGNTFTDCIRDLKAGEVEEFVFPEEIGVLKVICITPGNYKVTTIIKGEEKPLTLYRKH